MKIIIGSHNPVKIKATRDALGQIWPKAEFAELTVDPEVSVCPRSDEEALAGAKNRARKVWQESGGDLGIGLEGGTTTIDSRHMTGGWCAIFDGKHFYLGGGGHILLPPTVDRMVDQEHLELGQAMDSLTGGENTKQKSGAIGILTGGLSSRQKAYQNILRYALAPLVSAQLYQKTPTVKLPHPLSFSSKEKNLKQTNEGNPLNSSLSILSTIAVGSQNPLKLKATKSILNNITPGLEVSAISVPSGVSHTPLSNEETIAGARQRAALARKQTGANWGIGLEGGMAFIDQRWFSGVWAVIDDGKVTSCGGGVHFEIPESIAEKIVNKGEEMGTCLDSISGIPMSKQKMGAEGILTQGLINRESTFISALLYGLAPFLHPHWYQE